MAGAALGRLQSLLHLRLQHLTEGGPHPLLPRVRVLPHHLSDLVFAVLARWVILVSRLDLPPPPKGAGVYCRRNIMTQIGFC